VPALKAVVIPLEGSQDICTWCCRPPYRSIVELLKHYRWRSYFPSQRRSFCGENVTFSGCPAA